MTEAVRALRLVPSPSEGVGTTARIYASLGFDDFQRALAGLAAAGGPSFRFVGLHETKETWLDTDDARLRRAGLVVRLDGPVDDRVRAVAGRRPLDRVLELATRCHSFEGDVESASVRLQFEELRVVVPLRPGQRELCRLTMTGREAAVDTLAATLQTACELSLAPPLIAAVFDLAGVELPPKPDFGSQEIGPAISASALAFASLRRQAAAFTRNEGGTRLGEDSDALHDMRVAGRRMRAALGLFAPYIPARARGLRNELGRIGRILGVVRDFDVQLEQLAAWRLAGAADETAAFDAIEAVLVKRRHAARRRLLATLDGVRYERFLIRLTEFCRHGPGRRPAVGRRPALAIAPELIGHRYRAVTKAGKRLTQDSPPTEFHALRIRAKRLRYALEFEAPLYDGAVTAMIESLTALQDLLGEHQDAVVAVAHLQQLATTGRRALPPRALFLMGQVAARYEQRAKSLRRAFPKTFRRIRGRRWTALKTAMAKGQAAEFRGGLT